MKKKSKPDIFLLVLISLLILIGILALANVSVPVSLKVVGNAGYYLTHQLLYGFLPGIIVGLIIYFKVPLKTIKKLAFPFFIISYILMFTVLIPGIGRAELGAARWADVGPFSFQPSEILKLTSIIYLSALLSSFKQRNIFVTFLFFVGLIFISLIIQNNLSTLIIISTISFAIFLSAKTKIKYNLILWGLSLAGFVMMILFAPYRVQRLTTYLNPETDVLGSGYQMHQSTISIGSGGLTGIGLGLSEQKYGFVSQPMSDCIFAVFAEETGFIGASLLVILFLTFTYSCFSLAKRKNDMFPKLIVVGIGSWITVQAFVNIGAMVNLLPLSGTPLPFLSYGGTHIVLELIACSILLKISSDCSSC
ncbi:MAG: FtsW/RodA/SpoVE family cell cycle protein [Candidatus Pacebacteria bacterium]|nr:FtsW/RodA/SpoVE family cell cycle protein [Candidatus Paceibacterota bacterium]MDD5012989.1 FtsW/RodA/SpoVE family cell cycle protein [Candidatus Paceibacterota bacterium]MDD5752617.1 FtsW/RodA/SpoVE family cell cycle protein [Candidatus Paceibacterota bacterium]